MSEPAALTVAQLSERTGVPAGTLRMWEARYGFPGPARPSGGHRRYSQRDADLVRAAIAHRATGLSLPAAIARARETGRAQPASIFAGLKLARPELAPVFLTKHALLCLTRAIEDEQSARGGTAVLIGSFQRARFYRQSQRRWQELARTASMAVALADFRPRRGRRAGAAAVTRGIDVPHEISVNREHPLSREWSVIVSSPQGSACVAGWEIPAERELADAQRRFEVLWSSEPEVVHAAAAVAAAIIEPLATELVGELTTILAQPVAPSTPELRSASALMHRMVAYLGAAERHATAPSGTGRRIDSR